MSWIYHTIGYDQNMSFFGYDEIKMYVNDSHMATSPVVTIKFVIMESPCENEGFCIGELLLNLAVMEHFEKINGLVLWCLMPLSTNISVISWWSFLFVDETGISGEIHRPVAIH